MTNLLADLLRVHGFQVTEDAALEGRSGTLYKAPVLAERDGAWLFHALPRDRTIQTDMVAELSRTTKDVGATGAVIVHCGDEMPQTPSNLCTWGWVTLSRLVGEAQVAQTFGVAVPELPANLLPGNSAAELHLAPAAEDTAPVAPEPEADTVTGPEPEAPSGSSMEVVDGSDSFDLSVLDAASDLEPPAPSATQGPPAASPDAAPPLRVGLPPERDGEIPGTADPGPTDREDGPLAGLAAAADAFSDDDAEATGIPLTEETLELTHPVLAIQVPLAQAQTVVRDRTFSVDRVELILHPVHLMDFECDLLAEGSLDYETVSGLLQVHGTDKTVLEVESPVDPQDTALLPEELAPHVRTRAFRIPAERAQQLAYDAIVAHHTRMVDVAVEDPEQDFTVTEKREVAPRPDHVRIAPRGVFYRPVWRLGGTNGSLDVDAVTGVVQEEALRNPTPDIIMLD